MRQQQSQYRLPSLLLTTKSTFSKLALANLHLHRVLALQSHQLVQLLLLQKQEHNTQLAL
jgi:hypothetical protein